MAQTHDTKIQGSRQIFDHLCQNMNQISDLKNELREVTRQNFGEEYRMLSSPDQCQWMEMMMKLTGARRGIEIGVFTGYSALCFASGLPDDGQLIACDIEDTFVNIGRPFWERAGVKHKIDVRIGPATDTLDQLNAESANHGAFDFAYIDADKLNYSVYCDKVFPLLKSNGYIIIDNSLWRGHVADPEIRVSDENCAAIYACVNKLMNDERLEVCSLMLADGCTIVRKK